MAERAVATAKTSEQEQKCSSSCKQKPSFDSSGSIANRILQLQRTAGNQAVQRLIKSGTLQAKLTISEPGDIYEQEADSVSEQVMRTPDVNEATGEISEVLPPVPKYQLTMPSLGQTIKELSGQKQPFYFPEFKLRSREMSPEFKDDFLKMRGVTDLRYISATPGGAGKFPVPVAPSGGPTSDEKESSVPPIWTLDFEIEPKKDSELERVLNRAKIVPMLLNKEDENTPLGLKLLSTAVSVLAEHLQGKDQIKNLHLSNITVVANPSEGKYGLWGLIVKGEF
jgi:hypothetical protein